MIEIILMRPSVLGLDALQGCHFREDKWKQATTVQFYKSFRRNRREKNLVQLIGDTFLADDFDAFLASARDRINNSAAVKENLEGGLSKDYNEWLISKKIIKE